MLMATCDLCGKKDKSSLSFCGSSVCRKCFSRLGLDRLEGRVPPEDDFLASRMPPTDLPFLEGLNRLASLQPKALAWDLLDTAEEGLDEGVERIVIHADILAARAVYMFGRGKQRPEEVPADALGALLVFGSGVATALASGIAGEKPSSDKDELAELEVELDALISEMLLALKKRDDGTITESIGGLLEVLKPSE